MIKNAEEARAIIATWRPESEKPPASASATNFAEGYLAALEGPEHKAALAERDAYREVAIYALDCGNGLTAKESIEYADAGAHRFMAEKASKRDDKIADGR